ncbi:D-glycero-alpha-D-manno-heptose-1,7-bisphosphate 7-phosphatase [Brumimicrobium oceani]|uniref:D,D-heptose 1,7-bisphosphate phosphatase n=1 Tax=Brumimicrobium oceani TaxID=2100725 RepID=A0A2U2X287_9FLAO|nr:HAD-IIIA family hydrolase [Brumimicrobium oceani]PWH81864.1 phosphatase [Brumimicrobium oceani]
MSELKIDASWTLFLDRDGVINERNFEGYITSVEDFNFLPYAKEGLKELAKQFSRIIVVTNQQGVGKGSMSLAALEEIHHYMTSSLLSENVSIDHVFFASNLRGAQKDRRKPNSAMALEAKEMFPEIDFSKSVMVGDTASDLKFGMNLAMKTVLIHSAEKVDIKPDIKVNNLKEFADVLKS